MSSSHTYIINPVTNRKINVNGKVFQSLLNRGYIYDGTKLILPTAIHNVMRIPELLLEIFKHMENKDLRSLRLVCKSYNELAKEILFSRIITSVNSSKLNMDDYKQRQVLIDFLIDKGSIPLILQFLTSIPEREKEYTLRNTRQSIANMILLNYKVCNVNMSITQAVIPYASIGIVDNVSIIKKPEFLRLYLEYGLNLVRAIIAVLKNPELDCMLSEVLSKASYLFPGVQLIDSNNQPLIKKEELKRLMKQKWLCLD